MKLKESYIKLTSKQRRYQLSKPIVALTGGIATGKSTASNYLKSKYNLDIFDADQMIKEIYQTQEAFSFIQEKLPSSVRDNNIDFSILRNEFYTNKTLKDDVEKFLYERLEKLFVERAKSTAQSFIIYDVPLLFEKRLNHEVDQSILVYANRNIQIDRVRRRDGLQDEVILQILDAQMNIEEKKNLANIVLNNEGSKEELHRQLDKIVGELFY